MKVLTLKFPFSIDNQERETLIETVIERTQSVISFCLPYSYEITITNANFLKKLNNENSYIYVFEFFELEDAKNWILEPVAFVEFPNRNGNVKELEQEMNEFMEKYESFENKAKKKRNYN